MDCPHCHSKFNSASSLNKHMKSAKYCLKIQCKDADTEYNCICGKNFTQKSHLNTHVKSCYKVENIKLCEKNNELLGKISELQKLCQKLRSSNDILQAENKIYKEEHQIIINMAQQPKITNTTNSNNKIMNITSNLNFNDIDYIKNLIENNYTIDHMLNGQKGFAQFAIQNLLRDENGNLKYLCVDPSRYVFKYKDHTGEIQKDVKAKKLSSYLIDGEIKKKFIDVSNEWIKDENGFIDKNKIEFLFDKQNDVMNFEEDNNTFQKELIYVTI